MIDIKYPSTTDEKSVEARTVTESLVHPDGWYVACQQGVSFFLALILLVISAPVMLAAMGLVRLTSRGPAIYTQVRVGRNGRKFSLYKIRSMAHDCERLSGPRWSTDNDPRVTAVGRFLRRTHLDELPQLVNVLRGEMGLIGPRPERPEFVAKLEKAIPRYNERLVVRPGLTGLAQVQLPPDSDLESVRRKLERDLLYVEQINPWLDLRILIATAAKVIGLPREATCRFLALPTLKPAESEWTRSAIEDESQLIPA